MHTRTLATTRRSRRHVRAIHGTGAACLVLRALRGEPAREHLDRDRAPAARSDSRGQGADEPHLRPLAPVSREHPQGDRGAHRLPREGVHVGRDPVQRRDQARAAVRRRGGGPAVAQLHRDGAPAARHPARGAVRGVDHPVREGHAAQRGARGHRAAPQREDHGDPRQGDAAAGRVQPRPVGRGHEEQARSARGPRRGARAGAAGAVPPDQEQRRAHRRARGRQDRHRRGAGAAHRFRRHPALPGRQAAARARHTADRGRHQVPRAVRGTPQGDHEGADRESEHHRVHRRAAHAGGGGVGRGLARRGQHPEAGAVARRDSLHRSDDAGRVPEVHREGPLARAAVPGREGRAAHRDRSARDPQPDQGPLRALPPRGVLAGGDGGGGLPVEPLHHRSFPARQGHRPGGRGGCARQAAGRGLQRRIQRNQQEHPRRGRADGERDGAEGLRTGAVLPRAGGSRAREPPGGAREVRRRGGRPARGGGALRTSTTWCPSGPGCR